MPKERTRSASEAGKDISPSQVALYLENRPAKLEKYTIPPDSGVKDKYRGISKPPVSGAAFEWMDGAVGFQRRLDAELSEPCGRVEGQKFLSALNAIVESYRSGWERHGSYRMIPGEPKKGIPYSTIIGALWEDAAAVSTWTDGRTEEARAMRRAWDSLCHRVARDFARMYPGVRMWVDLYASDDDDEDTPGPGSADLPSRGRTGESIAREVRKALVRNEYRAMVFRIEQLETRGTGREEAKALVRQEFRCGKTRVDDALAFVKKERGDAQAC